MELPSGSRPIVGIDLGAPGAEDGHAGLGVQLPLLAPTFGLRALLHLHPGEHFTLRDEHGCGLTLVTWRAGYYSTGKSLDYPLIVGSAVIARADLYEQLLKTSEENLVIRDFLVADAAIASVLVEE